MSGRELLIRYRNSLSLTFLFRFLYRTHSEWTIERHHFQAQDGESLKTVDDDLIVIQESLDELFAAVLRWAVCVLVRVSLRGSRHCIPSLRRGVVAVSDQRVLPL
jgi:hypothetical protein